jgi:ribosomal protein S18 acetylase RimI-like enzyme
MITFSKAKTKELEEIYKVGKSISELKVSDEIFMSKKDLDFCIRNKDGFFLVAKEFGKVIGFSYGVKEAPTYASMMYTAVIPAYRRRGLGKTLLRKCMKEMKRRGVSSVYGLVTNNKAVAFLKKLGYKRGKTLIWMSRKL